MSQSSISLSVTTRSPISSSAEITTTTNSTNNTNTTVGPSFESLAKKHKIPAEAVADMLAIHRAGVHTGGGVLHTGSTGSTTTTAHATQNGGGGGGVVVLQDMTPGALITGIFCWVACLYKMSNIKATSIMSQEGVALPQWTEFSTQMDKSFGSKKSEILTRKRTISTSTTSSSTSKPAFSTGGGGGGGGAPPKSPTAPPSSPSLRRKPSSISINGDNRSSVAGRRPSATPAVNKQTNGLSKPRTTTTTTTTTQSGPLKRTYPNHLPMSPPFPRTSFLWNSQQRVWWWPIPTSQKPSSILPNPSAILEWNATRLQWQARIPPSDIPSLAWSPSHRGWLMLNQDGTLNINNSNGGGGDGSGGVGGTVVGPAHTPSLPGTAVYCPEMTTWKFMLELGVLENESVVLPVEKGGIIWDGKENLWRLVAPEGGVGSSEGGIPSIVWDVDSDTWLLEANFD